MKIDIRKIIKEELSKFLTEGKYIESENSKELKKIIEEISAINREDVGEQLKQSDRDTLDYGILYKISTLLLEAETALRDALKLDSRYE